jgi:hypothetical protein
MKHMIPVKITTYHVYATFRFTAYVTADLQEQGDKNTPNQEFNEQTNIDNKAI